MSIDPEQPFHRGELEIQSRVGVRDRIANVGKKVIRNYLPDEHRQFYAKLPMLFIASVDSAGRPWASVLAGRPGFVRAPDSQTLAVNAVPIYRDPLATNLDKGARIGVLGIEYYSRRRNRVNGEVSAIGSNSFEVSVGQTFGNCPQYIQARDYQLLPAIDQIGKKIPTRKVREFDKHCRQIIALADHFYIGTAVTPLDDNAAYGADVSHRGGKPGFVRIDNKRTLTVPDYVGNYLFNTLGNILLNPRAGLLFVDFASGDVLTITGEAKIIWDGNERSAFDGAERLIRFTLDEGILLEGALPIRWSPPEYSPNLEATGSWDEVAARLRNTRPAAGYRDFNVVRIEPESGSVTSFYLAPDDSSTIPRNKAGQFLAVEIQVPGFAAPFHRTYTISNIASQNCYRLSIKRELARSPDTAPGIVSNYFHDHVKVGSRIRAMLPRGKFALDECSRRGVVLLSAGVGVTPMISMLLHLVANSEDLNESRQVWFIHGARNGSEHAFRHEVREIAARHPWLNVHVRYSQPHHNDIELRDYDSVGHVDIELVDELIPGDEFDYYLCGPGSFVESLYVGLKEAGVQDKRIHYEFFSAGRTLTSPVPSKTNAVTSGSASTDPVRVHFAKSAVTAVWDKSKGSLLDLAESIGLRPAYSCRSGICQTCLTPVLAGEVAYMETPGAVPDEGQALICCAYPLGQDLNSEFVIDL